MSTYAYLCIYRSRSGDARPKAVDTEAKRAGQDLTHVSALLREVCKICRCICMCIYIFM